MRIRITLLILAFFSYGSGLLAGGYDSTLLGLKEKYSEYASMVLEVNSLKDQGKTIKAAKTEKEADKLFAKLFKPGTTYTVTKDCPLARISDSKFVPKCWQDDEFFKNNSSFEFTFEYIPANWANSSSLDFTSKSLIKFRTPLKNVEKLEDIRSGFTGKIQIGDNRIIDRNGLNLMMKVLDVAPVEE